MAKNRVMAHNPLALDHLLRYVKAVQARRN
jgi:hypothetical protein